MLVPHLFITKLLLLVLISTSTLASYQNCKSLLVPLSAPNTVRYDDWGLVRLDRSPQFAKKVVNSMDGLKLLIDKSLVEGKKILWFHDSFDMIHKAQILNINLTIESFLQNLNLNRNQVMVVVTARDDLLVTQHHMNKWRVTGPKGEDLPRPLQAKRYYNSESQFDVSPRLLELAQSKADFIAHIPDPMPFLFEVRNYSELSVEVKKKLEAWFNFDFSQWKKKSENVRLKKSLQWLEAILRALDQNQPEHILRDVLREPFITETESPVGYWNKDSWELLFLTYLSSAAVAEGQIYSSQLKTREDSYEKNLWRLLNVKVFEGIKSNELTESELIKKYGAMSLIKRKLKNINN